LQPPHANKIVIAKVPLITDTTIIDNTLDLTHSLTDRGQSVKFPLEATPIAYCNQATQHTEEKT